MARFFPRSLGGQLAGLLLIALLAAHLLSLLVFSGERSRAVDAAVRFGVVERVAAIVEVIDEASPELSNRLAAALSSRRTRLAIAAESALPPGGNTAHRARGRHLLASRPRSGGPSFLGGRRPRVDDRR